MMRFHNLGLSAFVCLLVVFSTSWVPNLSMVFTASQVLAQTGNQRKTEADRLFQQGIQQYQTSQFTAAIQSWLVPRFQTADTLEGCGVVRTKSACADYEKLKFLAHVRVACRRQGGLCTHNNASG